MLTAVNYCEIEQQTGFMHSSKKAVIERDHMEQQIVIINGQQSCNIKEQQHP